MPDVRYVFVPQALAEQILEELNRATWEDVCPSCAESQGHVEGCKIIDAIQRFTPMVERGKEKADG